jgi:formate/nitrite transporter
VLFCINEESGRGVAKKMKPLKPSEILDGVIEAGEEKGNSSFLRLAVLGFLAGAFIALAAAGSNVAAYNLLSNPDTYGIGKALAGAVFTTGLMLVVAAGGELFTGNTMMVASLASGKTTWAKMARNWVIVYLANMAGALMVAYFIVVSGNLEASAGLLGGVTIKIAAGKTSLTFIQGVILGILCNWLVCLGVWIAYGADTMTGKLLGCFFPIWLFVTSGFEHSVANMYYIPAGILAKGQETYLNLSGVTGEMLQSLNWSGFFLGNLIPVTLGNIVGGGLLVAGAYFLAYRKG